MKIGVVKTSCLENERRIPIYPDHLLNISEEYRSQMFFELGYGTNFGYGDDYFWANTAGVLSRESLFKECDLLLLPKPTLLDLKEMKENQVLWGWQHCVQHVDVTQVAIDKTLTLIAWEAMHRWSNSNEKLMHVFYKNNEIAGYASVLHSLEILGMDGHYGPRKHVVILGYGSVSRGAIYALQGRGFNNIHVYTKRPTHLVANQNPDVCFHQFHLGEDGKVMGEYNNGFLSPFIDVISQADIICNGVLQDTDNSLMFVLNDEISKLKPRSMIIDISCDKGMGFSFARPTSFENPVFTVGESVTYYSVDHTPTYLWNAASREISKAVLQYLPIIAKGPDAWLMDDTVCNAIEIRNGEVLNSKILTFQKRDIEYPHAFIVD